MDKRIKWGIIILVGAGLIGGGIYSQMPKQNEELAAADKVSKAQKGNKRILNVNRNCLLMKSGLAVACCRMKR